MENHPGAEQGNTTITFSPNLTGEFTCNSTKDKLNVLKTLDNYVVEMKENQNSNQSIYIKFNLDVGDGFPVVKSKLTPCIAVEFPLIVHLACPKNGKASKNKNQYFFINKTFNDKYKLYSHQ